MSLEFKACASGILKPLRHSSIPWPASCDLAAAAVAVVEEMQATRMQCNYYLVVLVAGAGRFYPQRSLTIGLLGVRLVDRCAKTTFLHCIY